MHARLTKRRHVLAILVLSALAVTLALTHARLGSPFATAGHATRLTSSESNPQTPNVIMSPVATAETAISSLATGVQITTQTVDSPTPDGTVVAQIPAPGSPLASASQVQLVVSDGTIPAKELRPFYYTSGDIYFDTEKDVCDGMSNCASLLAAPAWGSDGNRPEMVGLLEKDGCVFDWDQYTDGTYTYGGLWYASVDVSIKSNGCSGNDSWRLSWAD